MSIARDYFLLYHGIHFSPEEKHVTLTLDSADAEKLPYFALLLDCSDVYLSSLSY